MTQGEELRPVILYALLLNGLWEYIQLRPLYTCWEQWSPWQKMLFLPLAIAGDVVIVLSVALVARLITGGSRLVPEHAGGWILVLALSFGASLFFEWIARRLGLWDYRSAMRVLRLGKENIGLAPVLQITLLPAASLLLTQMFPL